MTGATSALTVDQRLAALEARIRTLELSTAVAAQLIATLTAEVIGDSTTAETAFELLDRRSA